MTQTDEITSPEASPAPRPRVPSWLAAVLVAAAFFAAVAPTLPWQEFAGGSENLVAQTVLEMRRGGRRRRGLRQGAAQRPPRHRQVHHVD